MLFCALSCFCFASLLNAFEVGKFVRIEGLISRPELNGTFGKIKALGSERHQVKVLLSDKFSAPANTNAKHMSTFFESLLIKPQNLILISEEDWKVDFAPMFTEETTPNDSSEDIESLLKRNLDASQYAKHQNAELRLSKIDKRFGGACIFRDRSEEMNIIGLWMNQTFGTSFLDSFPSPYKYGDLVKLHSLDKASAVNGRLGVVNRCFDEACEVFIITPIDGPHQHSKNLFTILHLRDNNIRPLTGFFRKCAPQLSFYQIDKIVNGTETLASIENSMTLSERDKKSIIAIKRSALEMCYGNGELLYYDPDMLIKGRLLGASILYQYREEGLSYACEFEVDDNANFHNRIKELWEKAGKWRL